MAQDDDRLKRLGVDPHMGARVILVCMDCGKEYDATLTALLGGLGVKRERKCRDCMQKAQDLRDEQAKAQKLQSDQYNREIWRQHKLRLPDEYMGKNFRNFDQTGNEEAVGEIIKWARDFPTDRLPRKVPSLLISSPDFGVGKTHLAGACLHYILDQFTEFSREACPFQFWSVNDMKARLESAHSFKGTETVQDFYNDMGSMWLLVLDDVGKETGTRAAELKEMYYTVVNTRYGKGLPIILTSNFGFDPWTEGAPALDEIMGPATVSRLRGMTQGTEYVIRGHDRR